MIRATVALAGATGFLGRRILKQLVSGGYGIRILVRRPPNTLDLSGRGISHVQGDLSDADALAALVRGTDVVINAAGLIKAHNREAFFEVNEAGARRVAQAADGRRLIHVSSLAARGPQLSDYAASKRAGERAVHEVAGSAVIVRPPMIYGPGDRETLVLFRAARGPVIAIPAKSDARLAIAHVDDVAAAIVDLGASPADFPIATIGGDRPNGYSWPRDRGSSIQSRGWKSTNPADPRLAIRNDWRGVRVRWEQAGGAAYLHQRESSRSDACGLVGFARRGGANGGPILHSATRGICPNRRLVSREWLASVTSWDRRAIEVRFPRYRTAATQTATGRHSRAMFDVCGSVQLLLKRLG